MATDKKSFVRGLDPKTAINLGIQRSAREWLDNMGIEFSLEKILVSKDESGNGIVEVQIEDDMNAAIRRMNPDFQSGLNATVKIVFSFPEKQNS
ncbi:MAG: hypothetical protein K9J30_08945 [Bacteroidales bacterium]|nr:hypothetical protein [Bacteroidales bacterium]